MTVVLEGDIWTETQRESHVKIQGRWPHRSQGERPGTESLWEF
jgi:hypothetical protein